MGDSRSALVIDNNPIRRVVVSSTLSRFGIKVSSVGTRMEAAHLYEGDHVFDLVVLRLGSGEGMKASAIARLLRSGPSVKCPYIVGMSSTEVPGEKVLLSEVDAVHSWPFKGETNMRSDVDGILHKLDLREFTGKPVPPAFVREV